MRVIRSRLGALAMLSVVWHIAALLLLPAICCQLSQASSVEEGLACTMEHGAGQVCPMHGDGLASEGQSFAPQIGCAATELAMQALLGPSGVLPAPVAFDHAFSSEESLPSVTLSPDSHCPVPFSPPPRA